MSVALPEPQAMPSVQSGDGSVTLSQIGLRVELDTDETAVDVIDYAALRMTDGSEIVIIDEANDIDRTLYAARRLVRRGRGQPGQRCNLSACRHAGA